MPQILRVVQFAKGDMFHQNSGPWDSEEAKDIIAKYTEAELEELAQSGQYSVELYSAEGKFLKRFEPKFELPKMDPWITGIKESKPKLTVYRSFFDASYHENKAGANPWSENPEDVLKVYTIAELHQLKRAGQEIELVDWATSGRAMFPKKSKHADELTNLVEKALQRVKEKANELTFFEFICPGARRKD